MSFPRLTIDQKVALFDAGFGPTDATNSTFTQFDVGGRRCHITASPAGGGVEFGPWTTYWNPDQYFDTVEAAVAWAEVERWGQSDAVEDRPGSNYPEGWE